MRVLTCAAHPSPCVSAHSVLSLDFVEKDVLAKGYLYAVLLPKPGYDTRALAQLYRDRGDAENAFDALRYQLI